LGALRREGKRDLGLVVGDLAMVVAAEAADVHDNRADLVRVALDQLDPVGRANSREAGVEMVAVARVLATARGDAGVRQLDRLPPHPARPVVSGGGGGE